MIEFVALFPNHSRFYTLAMFSFGPSGDGNKGGGEHLSTAVDNIQVNVLEGKDAGDLALLARKVRSTKTF